jgi:hypothetical protein
VTWTGRKKGRGIPPGVKAAALADQLAGGRTLAETARSFGIDVLTVRRLAETISGIDPDEVRRIQTGLPALLAVLGGAHAAEALERVHSDPATAVKSTFGAKLAAEAARLTAPVANNPGGTVLAFIEALGKAGGGSLTVGATPDPLVLAVEAEVLPADDSDAGPAPGSTP